MQITGTILRNADVSLIVKIPLWQLWSAWSK